MTKLTYSVLFFYLDQGFTNFVFKSQGNKYFCHYSGKATFGYMQMNVHAESQ